MVLGVTGLLGFCAANLVAVESKKGPGCVTSQNLTMVDYIAQETELIEGYATSFGATLLVSLKSRNEDSDSCLAPSVKLSARQNSYS